MFDRYKNLNRGDVILLEKTNQEVVILDKVFIVGYLILFTNSGTFVLEKSDKLKPFKFIEKINLHSFGSRVDLKDT